MQSPLLAYMINDWKPVIQMFDIMNCRLNCLVFMSARMHACGYTYIHRDPHYNHCRHSFVPYLPYVWIDFKARLWYSVNKYFNTFFQVTFFKSLIMKFFLHFGFLCVAAFFYVSLVLLESTMADMWGKFLYFAK